MASMIYLGLFVFSAVFAIGAFLFGHDHDVEHDFGGADHGGGGGHGSGIPSVFSARVLSLFLVGFSGIGLLCTNVWHFGSGVSALSGLGAGVVMGAFAYGLIYMFDRAQFNSMAVANDYVGRDGRVSGAIPAGGTGEIAVTVKEQLRTVFAVSADGSAIPEGRSVKIVKMTGATATVQAL